MSKAPFMPDMALRKTLTAVLESQQGIALMNREKRVSERYKGGRLSVMEPAEASLDNGFEPERKRIVSLDSRASSGFLDVVDLDIKSDKSESLPWSGSKNDSPRNSAETALTTDSLDLEKLSASSQHFQKPPMSKIATFLAQQNRLRADPKKAKESESGIDQLNDDIEAEMFSEVEDEKEEGEVLEIINDTQRSELEESEEEVMESAIHESSASEAWKNDESEVMLRNSLNRNKNRSNSTPSTTLGRKKKRRKDSTFGNTLKKVSSYVTAASMKFSGGYKERKYYEAKKPYIATEEEELRLKHLQQSRYYFNENPFRL